MTKRTELGKIKTAKFGIGGYQDACIGLHITLGGESWGVGDTRSTWDANLIKHSESSKWTEADRSKQNDEIVRYVSDLLRDAKVNDVSKLAGIPVEVTFEGMTLSSWRILKEVL